MDLSVEHNLSAVEMFQAVIALTKGHGLEHEVHDCLAKAIEDGPVIPRDPVVREIVDRWMEEYRAAISWIRGYVDRYLADGDRKGFFKAQPAAKYPDGPLTREQIREIQQAIRERFNYFASSFESNFTPDSALLKKWKKLGIVAPDVRASDFVSNVAGHLVRNAFIFGRLQAAIERGAITYADVLHHALHSPLTRPDHLAVKVAEQQAAAYITKFGEDLATGATQLIAARNRKIVHDMVVDYHKQELQAVKLNATAGDRIVTDWRQLASELYHTMEDKARDWQRIAYYESYDAKQQGQGLAIMAEKGPDALVYKQPMPTACPQCKHLYLHETGLPRLFRVRDMLAFGNNIGRKPMPVKGGVVSNDTRPDGADTLKPVMGLVHPWCQCVLYRFTGWEPWADMVPKP